MAISSIELYETCKEFSTSEYERSTTSTAENRREKEEYNFRVGVLAAQVLGSKSFSKGFQYSKGKFKMDFSMKGGGGSRVPFTYFEKLFF